MNLLRGIGVPPWLVASLRALVEGLGMAGLAVVAVWLTEDKHMVAIAPIGLFVIRWLEGLADQIDPEKHT